MTSRLSFHWLLTLIALVAPAAVGPSRTTREADPAPAHQATSDVVFRHYL